MRPSSLAFAFACAVALPSGAALFGAHRGDDVANFLFYAGLFGVGLFVGMVVMLVLDWYDFLTTRAVELDGQRVSHAERWAKLQPVAAPEPVEVAEPDEQADCRPDWRVACHRFVTAGNLYGFGVRDIGAGPHKVIDWDDWATVRDYLIDAGVLSPKGGTRWAAGWDYARWQAEYAVIPLPPVRVAPPEVLLTVNNARQQRQQRPPEVVDGTARAVE